MTRLFPMATSLALMAACVLTAAAQDNSQRSTPQNQQAQNQQQEREKEEKSVRTLKIIKLQHRNPQQLQQVIGLRHGGLMPGVTGRQAFAAARARAAGRPPGAEPKEEDKLSIAVSEDEKLLFVRGSESQIQEIEQLVKTLDVEDGALEPIEYADHRLIPIPRENTSHIQTTLTQLELRGQMLQIGEMTLIAFQTDEEHAEESKQAEEVIQTLNEAAKASAEKKAKEKKDQEKKDQEKKDAPEKAEQAGDN